MKRNHLILMNSIHNTNQLKWKLFTMMMKDEHENWIFAVHMLIAHENDDIIETFFRQIKRWTKVWKFRYIIIDDSAAEQRTVNLTFRNLIDDEIKISHFFCRTHSKRTLNGKLADFACKNAKKHLYDALYFRKTKMKCDDSLKKTMRSIFNEKRQYIEREWMLIKQKWINYVRQHSCLLLQCMIINAVESWHASIKKHADDELIIN